MHVYTIASRGSDTSCIPTHSAADPPLPTACLQALTEDAGATRVLRLSGGSSLLSVREFPKVGVTQIPRQACCAPHPCPLCFCTSLRPGQRSFDPFPPPPFPLAPCPLTQEHAGNAMVVRAADLNVVPFHMPPGVVYL